MINMTIGTTRVRVQYELSGGVHYFTAPDHRITVADFDRAKAYAKLRTSLEAALK